MKQIVVALDSNVLIYALKGDSEFGDCARSLLLLAESSSLDAQASVIAEFEVLSYDKITDSDARGLQRKLHSFGVEFADIDEIVLLHAAKLRRKHGLGAMDSIHVATALQNGATHFVTNDHLLLKKKVPGIKIVPLKDWQKYESEMKK